MLGLRRFTFILILALIFQAAYASEAILTTLDGQKIAFNSLKGKWIFLNYWASWCQPCLDEIGEFNHFYDQQKNKIALFAINYDMLSFSEQIKLIKKYNIHYPSLKNDPAKDLQLQSIPGVPATFVFNPEGKLTQTLFGPQTKLSLNEVISETN
jgi:thiol-disulfide isomerase/thioredoxin